MSTSERFIVLTRRGWADSIAEFIVARECDVDGRQVPSTHRVACFPVGFFSERTQSERANLYADALNKMYDALPKLELTLSK